MRGADERVVFGQQRGGGGEARGGRIYLFVATFILYLNLFICRYSCTAALYCTSLKP